MDNSKQISPRQPTQFFRLPQLKSRLNVSGSTIWSWVKKGTFPKPIKLSENCTAWIAEDVERWATERIAESQLKKSSSKI